MSNKIIIDCQNLENGECFKLKIILDKDMTDAQYVACVAEVCGQCKERIPCKI